MLRRPPTLLLFAAVFLLVTTAFARSQTPTPRDLASEAHLGAQPLYAWFRTGGGRYRTYVFRRGRIVSRRSGAWIAVGTELAQLSIERRSQPPGGPNADCPLNVPSQELETERLVLRTPHHTDVLLGFIDADDSYMELHHSIRLVASMGPYLAVEIFTNHFPHCATHGHSGTHIVWIDLRDGQHLSVDAPAGIDTELEQARSRLHQDYELDSARENSWRSTPVVPPAEAHDEIEHLEVEPKLDADSRRWTSLVHASASTSYTHSGTTALTSRTSYYITTSFQTANLSPPIDGHANVPSAVVTFDTRYPYLDLGGVSRPSSAN